MRPFVLLLVASTAVAAPPSPPPAALGLQIEPFYLMGSAATIVVTGVTPGERVVLAASTTRRGAAICPARFAPTCLDITQPVYLAGSAQAGASGTVVFHVNLPLTTERRVFFQAVSPTGPHTVETSALRASWFLEPYGDHDGDGLLSVYEVFDHFTDPLDPDTDGGGESDGDEVTALRDPLNPSDDVLGDRPPYVQAVTLTPSDADETDTLVCDALSIDLDGDPITLSYTWLVNAAVVPSATGPTLDGSVFDRGDTVSCRVVAEANGLTSAVRQSNVVRIVNAPPVVQAVTITPIVAGVGDVLTCTASVFDPDGDPVTLAYTWTVAGATTPIGGGSTLATSAAGLSAGDEVACTVVAADDADTSVPATAQVTLQ
ncbi:MAG: hypothetical protein H6733_04150 [Alphaproteobacteria bacterium]|nr:hypothetical protein [Alphaproteobacteria bacterium]